MSKGLLADYMGIKLTSAEPKNLEAYLQIEKRHLNPSGFSHSGTVVTLAAQPKFETHEFGARIMKKP
ncbi:MAG: hypothetical protein JKY46_03660 [Robiginitomaculum sp.]|nr:hypothetical protein [Robiginitomaculum sp.]